MKKWAIALVLMGWATSAFALKDLSSRLGVGYSDQFGVDGGLPSLAVRYYQSNDFAMGAALGVDTIRESSRFGFSAKVMRILFPEDNMLFFLGASAGLVSQDRNGENTSGFDLTGFGGAEFFLPGLDSLGFNFEFGIGVTSVSNEVRFRTLADHPFRAGMFFYF
jgi:hypothetical protein